MNNLYTIGYEGSDIDRLVRTLRILKIEVLADVRELPISRKRGFSKNRLREILIKEGIQYRHFRDLGDPKSGRDAARAGKISEFRDIFLEQFNSESAQTAFEALITLAKDYRTCMLCFERCALDCHRSMIADAAAMRGMNVYNLIPDEPEKYIGNERKIPRYNPRQSATAAE